MGTPGAEIEIDEALVHALLTDQCPHLADLPVRIVANGWDNVIARVGDEWMARLPRRAVAVPLVLLGLVLLSLGLAAAYPLHIPISNPKMIFTWCVWGMYALIAVVMWRHILSARQTAWLAVVGFLVPLVSLWIVTKA